MKNYNILSPSEKVKQIRLNLGLNQEELSGGERTRNLVSVIENNKANLTETTAKIITNNINNICKLRNLDFSVTPEYLLETTTEQAKKIADEYINYIKSLEPGTILNDDILCEIDIFSKTYDTEDKKPLLYIEIGLHFKNYKQFSKATEYFLKAYESCSDLSLTTRCLTMLTSCNIYLSKYTDAINYSRILLDLNKSDHTQFHARYNIALCYKKLKEYSKALDILYYMIEKYPSILQSSLRNIVDVNLLIGVCLNESKSFNKSIAVYKNLLKLVDDKKYRLLILLNLCDVYRDTEDIVRLKKTCTDVLDHLNENADVLDVYGAYAYFSLARDVKMYGESDIVIELLLKALNLFRHNNTSLYLEDLESLFIDLLDLYIKKNDTDSILFLKSELFELIENKLISPSNMASLQFIRYFNRIGNPEEVENFIAYLTKK